jgi:site-specific DNA recombinase
MKPAIYARLSRDRNGESTSIARQIEACRKFVDAPTYEDNDTSGWSGKVRPAWERLLSDIEAGRVDTVYSYALDRVARRPQEIERLLATGCRLVTIRDNLDSETASSELFIRILAAVAKMESDNTSARIRSKHDELRQNGKFSGGRHSMGDKEGERVLIRNAARDLIAGKSLRSVALAWVRDVTTVKRVLLSPRMVGRRWVGSGLSPQGMDPVLTDEEWNKVRSILTDPKRKKQGRPATHILSGILRCGKCGSRMTARRSTTKALYVCSREKGCGTTITAALAEQQVLQLIEEWTHSAEYRDIVARRVQLEEKNEQDLAEVRAELQGNIEKRTTLIDMWTHGSLSTEEWQSARGVLDEKIREAEALLVEPKEVEAPVPQIGANEIQAMRRHQVAALLDAVIVHPVPRGHPFDPGRIEPRWKGAASQSAPGSGSRRGRRSRTS